MISPKNNKISTLSESHSLSNESLFTGNSFFANRDYLVPSEPFQNYKLGLFSSFKRI